MSKISRQAFLQAYGQGMVYGIIDPCFIEQGAVEQVKALLAAQVPVIQYRNKSATVDQKRRELQEICALAGVERCLLIVNDEVQLAKEFPVQGLHLGQEDSDPRLAREIIGPELILGYSTHNPQQAQHAMTLPIDYIGVGPCFQSQTKPDAQEGGLPYLEWALANVNLPVVAIGGISEQNLPELVQRGAKAVAMISDLGRTMDKAGKVARLQRLLKG